MAIPFESGVVVPETVLFQELDGESVLLNMETETYFGLDAVGTRFWTVLAESDSIQAAFDTLLGEFEVSPDTLRQDLSDLIQRLVASGLMEFEG